MIRIVLLAIVLSACAAEPIQQELNKSVRYGEDQKLMIENEVFADWPLGQFSCIDCTEKLTQAFHPAGSIRIGRVYHQNGELIAFITQTSQKRIRLGNITVSLNEANRTLQACSELQCVELPLGQTQTLAGCDVQLMGADLGEIKKGIADSGQISFQLAALCIKGH